MTLMVIRMVYTSNHLKLQNASEKYLGTSDKLLSQSKNIWKILADYNGKVYINYRRL